MIAKPRAPLLLRFAIVLALHGGAACQKTPAQNVPPLPRESSHDAASSNTKSSDEPPVHEPDEKSAERATLELEGGSVVIGVADAEAIRAALIARIEQSAVPDRAYLLSVTKLPIELEADAVRIGVWGVLARGSELTLFHRMGAGTDGLRAYQAELTQQAGTWRVGEVAMVSIHPRR